MAGTALCSLQPCGSPSPLHTPAFLRLFRNTEVSAECKTPQPNIPAENCEQILTEKKGPGSIVLLYMYCAKFLFCLSLYLFLNAIPDRLDDDQIRSLCGALAVV